MKAAAFLSFMAMWVMGVRAWRIFEIRESGTSGSSVSDFRSYQSETSSECLQYAALGSCGFYSCLERRFPCGADGFAIKVGKHFCDRGTALMNQFTTRGREFFNRFLTCQTNALLSVYQSYLPLTCPAITNQCVNTMITCSQRVYGGMDFCGFIGSNSAAYNRLYGYDEISRLISFGQPALISNLFTGGSHCGSRAITYRVNRQIGTFSEFLSAVRTSWATCRDRVTTWFTSF